MTARSRLACYLTVALALALPACTNFTTWVPVTDGAEAAADHAVQVEGVVVHVEEFGVLDGWGKPTATLNVRNGGLETVTFDLAKTQLEIGAERHAPTLEAGKPSLVSLQPRETFETQLTFATTLPIQARDGTNQADMQVLTREMILRLPPLMIGGTEHMLPAMAYRNPDP